MLGLLCIIKGLTVYLPLSTSSDEAITILTNHIISLITVSIGNIYHLFAARGIYSPFCSVGKDLCQLQLKF